MNYIVALGNGLTNLEDGGLDLTVESKMTALAAIVLYKNKVGEKIIFSGGFTEEKGSEAGKMLEFVKSELEDIPLSDIILDENSIDTADNAVEVKKILPSESKFIIVSFGYHLKRAKRIFRNFGLKAHGSFASEDVLKNHSPNHSYIFEKYNWKRKLVKIQREIFCLFLVYTIDPKGKILRVITSKSRGN